MSQVRNVQLEITPRQGEQWNAEVSYEARFTNREIQNNILFIERITIFGQDPFQEEELIRFNRRITAQSNIQQVNRTFNVRSEILDEDEGIEIGGFVLTDPRDEVLAQVDLIRFQINPGRRRSRLVQMNF